MKLKKTLFAGMLAFGVSASALANDELMRAPIPQFTTTDASLLFEPSAEPMQLAVLSPQEMKETEGAIFWLRAGLSGLAGGIANGVGYASSVPSQNRTTSGWATAVGSGFVGGVVGSTPLYTSAFWGAGIALGGGYTATSIGTLNNVQSR